MTTDAVDGRVVLVTGGAKGVGREVVRAFARRGATVLVNYFHSREAAQELRAELAAQGVEITLLRGSVARRDQVDAMFDTIARDVGHLDVLVNNAALGALRPLPDLDERDWTRTFDTILKGSLWCARRAAELMPAGGAIVNLSSVGSPFVLDSYTAIGTAKAALESLTRYLAVEFAPAGIRVNTASGGLLDGSVAGLFPDAARLRATVVGATPLGRLGTEAELAQVVQFLASPGASWVTGQCLVADGGLSLGHAMLTAGTPVPHPGPVGPPIGPPAAEAAGAQPASPGIVTVPTVSEPPADAPAVGAGAGIAVVGMGLTVPGAADPEEFFRLLLGDRPVFSEPGERWDIDSFWAPPGSGVPDSTYSRTLGFIHDQQPGGPPTEDYTTTWLRRSLQQALTGVHRTEADRHLFAVGYTADGSQHLEEAMVWAGIRQRLADPADPAASAALPHLRRLLPHLNDDPAHSLPHAVGTAAAAGLLPADTELLMLDTACSSSLFAVETAVQALRTGSCDVAVAGAAFAVGPRHSTLFAGLHGLSASNDVRSFDADADGVLFSDGAAVIVLKTLDRARADNDRILGLLTGVGTSADGRGKAIYAPNTKGQQVAIERAWTAAGIGAADLDWVVAHGTGTRAGDQVEVQTLRTALATSPGLWVTSNKSIVGHTGWVAGIVSLIHVLTALEHRLIPGQRRFTAAPAAWDLDSSSLRIPTTDQPWPGRPDRPRTAAVSGFGFGGTNAHAVVREYDPAARYTVDPVPPVADDPVVLVGWSARLPGDPDRDAVRRWLSGHRTDAPDPSFGEQFPLPPVGTFRIPSTTLTTIDRGQVLAMQCVLDLDPALARVLDRHRAGTGVVAGHLGPTRNAIGYALRSYLRYLSDRIAGDAELAALRPGLAAFAGEVCSLVPETNEDATPGIMPNIIPARITNYFGYTGSNLTVDTGFGSGLAATGLAVNRIREGGWDVGLVLGVNGNSLPELSALLGTLPGGAAPAEGAALLVLTRRSLAEAEGLPVLAELDVCRDGDAAGVAVPPTVPPTAPHTMSPTAPPTVPPDLGNRHYLGAQGTLELLAALDRSADTVVTCTDPITGARSAIRIRPLAAGRPAASAARPDTHPVAADPATAPTVPTPTAPPTVPTPAAPPTVPTPAGPAPVVPLPTVEPFAVQYRRWEGENVRSALPALPPQCLIVTDRPDDLPAIDPSCLVLSSGPYSGLPESPEVVALTGPATETSVADAIAAFGRPLRHLRVILTLGADRDPTAPGFPAAMVLADLTFLAIRSLFGGTSAGSCCLLALDAVRDARPRAVTGMFTGMLRTLRVERPELDVIALLTTTASAADGLTELADESRRARLLPVTVLDAGRRYVPVPVPRTAAAGGPGPIRLTRASVVVAAGGSRGVTAAILKAIAHRSAPTMWVLGTNRIDGLGPDEPRPSRAEFLAAAHAAGTGRTMAELNRVYDRLARAREARETIDELRRACGPDRVHYRACDLTDAPAVQRTIDEITAVSGRVDLVVLGAGINRSAALDRKRLTDFRAVRDVKVLGYAHLRRAFAGRPPAAWCNFGSILGFTGQPGEIDYTAGNDLLAAAAAAGRDDGCDEFTLGWTLWDTIGLAADPVTRGFLHRSGFSGGISTAEGISLFLAELERPRRDRVTVHLGAAERAMLESRFPGLRAAMADAVTHPAPPVDRVDPVEQPPAIGRRSVRASNRTFDSTVRSFDCLLDLEHDPYLVHHLVDDRPTLPGTFALELAATAAEELCPGQRTVAFERVNFRSFLRLHPTRKSLAIRVTATRITGPTDGAGPSVRVAITSDVRAPSGELLVADRVHADLDVRLADRAPAGPTASRGVVAGGRPSIDPYLRPNPLVHLSGPLDTLRSPVRGDAVGQAMFGLRSAAYRSPFDRFRIPALLLDGLARTCVLAGGDAGGLPLMALSGIRRVDLFDSPAEGRNDIALARRFPRIRLIAGPDPAVRGTLCGEAVTESGAVLARISGLAGVLLGWCDASGDTFRPTPRDRETRFVADDATRSSGHLLQPATVAALDE